MSKTTINISDPESGVPDLTLTIDGTVGATGEEFAGALIDLARQAYASTFTDSFDEQVVDMFLFKFERRQEEETKPSEFDLGYGAGKKAGYREAEEDAAQTISDTTDLTPGDRVRITRTQHDANPRHGFAVGKVVTLHDEPDPNYYGQPRRPGQEKYDEAWRVRRGGLFQWVHPDDFERVEDEPVADDHTDAFPVEG